ncbi:uncharacterized protein LOC144446826 [Glandiceps talaboti]
MASSSSQVDPNIVDGLVNHVKSAGLFDQFRRDCLNDVDTKPAYQNLRQRVEGYVSNFLSKHTWAPNLNKKQLRDSLRRQIHQSEMLSIGVERIVEQVVEPKIHHIFRPQIETAFQEYTEKAHEENRREETVTISENLASGSSSTEDNKAGLSILATHPGTTGTPPSVKSVHKMALDKPIVDIPARVRTVSETSEKSIANKPVKTAGDQPPKKQVTDSSVTPEVKSRVKEGASSKSSKDLKKSGGKVLDKTKSATGKSLKVGEGKKSDQSSLKIKGGEAEKSGVTGKLDSSTCMKMKTTEQSGKQTEKQKSADIHMKSKVEQSYKQSDKPDKKRSTSESISSVGDKSVVRKQEQLKGVSKEEKHKSDVKDKTETSKSGERSDKMKTVIKAKDSSDKVKSKDKTSEVKKDKIVKTVKEEKTKLSSTKSDSSCDKKSGMSKILFDVKGGKEIRKEKAKTAPNKDSKGLAGKERDGTTSKEQQKDMTKGTVDIKKKSSLESNKYKGSERTDDAGTCTKVISLSKASKESKKEVKKESTEVKEKKVERPKENKNSPEQAEKSTQGMIDNEISKISSETVIAKTKDNQAVTDQVRVNIESEESPKLEGETSGLEDKSVALDEPKSKTEELESVKQEPLDKDNRDEEFEEDDDDDVSDITVSSVHTSDLSSFEDEISSVSSPSSTSSDEDLSSDEKDDTDRSSGTGKRIGRESPYGTGSISGDSEKSGASKRRPSYKALALNRYYSDSEDEESREERRKKAAKEKEERAARRQMLKEDMNERLKQYEEEKKKKRDERKKAKQALKEKEEAEKGRRGRRTKEQKKEEKVQAKREQKVLEKRMALRRQRTLNKKYLSEDFTSIFTDKETSFIKGDPDSENDNLKSDSGMSSTSGKCGKKRRNSQGNDDSGAQSIFYMSNIPDVGPSYEQTFIAKAMELATYSCGLRRSCRKISGSGPSPTEGMLAENQESGVQLPPRKRGRRASGASTSSTELSTNKDRVEIGVHSRDLKAGSDETTEREKRDETPRPSSTTDFESPATPTQDEPAFPDDPVEGQAVMATAGDSAIPIYSLTPLGNQPIPPPPVATISQTGADKSVDKKERDETDIGVVQKKEDKDVPKKVDKDVPKKVDKDVQKKEDKDVPKKEDKDVPKKEDKDVPKKEDKGTLERRGRSRTSVEERLPSQRRQERSSRSDSGHEQFRRSERDSRSSMSESRRDRRSLHDKEERKSPNDSYGIRPRRQSSREHYKPMSDQFDYYSGRKSSKDDDPRGSHSSHLRHSPPRESRSRKRHASSPPPKEHRQSKYRGYPRR